MSSPSLPLTSKKNDIAAGIPLAGVIYCLLSLPMQMHIDKDDVIGQLLAAFTLKLDRESQLMKLLHSRTPVQKTRKGLQHMDHISQYEDQTLMHSV